MFKNRFNQLVLVFSLVVSLGTVYLAPFFRGEAARVSLDLPSSDSPNEITQTITINPAPIPQLTRAATLIVVGDIMPSRVVAKKVQDNQDFNYPFAEVKDYLKGADMVFANLESPITPGRKIKSGEMMFRSEPQVAQALKDANIGIVSLANNHSPNFGPDGLKDTFKYLTEAEVRYVGAGNNATEANAPTYLELNGLKLAFLAYNDPSVVPVSYKASTNKPGTAFMDLKKMQKTVAQAKNRSDAVLVSMHAGTEYTEKPNKQQQEFARAAIDAGAEIVIGHHPHVVQSVEIYKGKYIIYSLGNFVFDQMWSRATREGMMATILLNAQGVKTVDFTPILIEDYSQPRILDGKEAAAVLKRLKL